MTIMGSIIGESLKISIFGESHGPAVGAVLDGLPAGFRVDLDTVNTQMARRAPGADPAATPRWEADTPQILSGLYNGRTTGAPLAAVIGNTSVKSEDYAAFADIPRPSHADYPAGIRYGGFNDPRGGGHFSGRLTAPLLFAGSVCRQILAEKGVVIGGHVLQIGDVADEGFDLCDVDSTLLERLSGEYFPVIGAEAKRAMYDEIMAAKERDDSVGGIVEAAAVNVPAGLGNPMFGGAENKLAALVFGIPAVKGVEFGSGFGGVCGFGSVFNDAYVIKDGEIKTKSNNNGGILGGLTTGMPVVLRVAFKPTPSIAAEQDSVDLSTMENVKMTVGGRHDPCIVPRAVPVVEAAMAVGLLDLMMCGGMLGQAK